MASKELLDGLNHALNREVTTFLRYIQQGAAIKGSQWDAVRNMYLNEVNDEVGHAQYLANQIVMLGGTPKIDPDLTPPPDDVKQMLKNDIKEEELDVTGYAELASLAEKEGFYELKMRMEEQASDESGHAQEMKRMLG